jgi:hypothetical protein
MQAVTDQRGMHLPVDAASQPRPADIHAREAGSNQLCVLRKFQQLPRHSETAGGKARQFVRGRGLHRAGASAAQAAQSITNINAA